MGTADLFTKTSVVGLKNIKIFAFRYDNCMNAVNWQYKDHNSKGCSYLVVIETGMCMETVGFEHFMLGLFTFKVFLRVFNLIF